MTSRRDCNASRESRACRIEVVWEPIWTKARLTEDGKAHLREVGNIGVSARTVRHDALRRPYHVGSLRPAKVRGTALSSWDARGR